MSMVCDAAGFTTAAAAATNPNANADLRLSMLIEFLHGCLSATTELSVFAPWSPYTPSTRKRPVMAEVPATFPIRRPALRLLWAHPSAPPGRTWVQPRDRQRGRGRGDGGPRRASLRAAGAGVPTGR